MIIPKAEFKKYIGNILGLNYYIKRRKCKTRIKSNTLLYAYTLFF